MRHFNYLSVEQVSELFHVAPAEFDVNSDKAVLATALGATLYCPAIRPNLAEDVIKLAAQGVKSVVICLEDSIPDERLAEGESNVVGALEELSKEEYSGKLPLLFVRVRTPQHFDTVIAQNHKNLSVLTGFAFPKFEEVDYVASGFMERLATVNASRRLSGLRALYAMPILESPVMAHRETRDTALMNIKAVLDAHKEEVLVVRIGATDLASNYGLRRSPDLTIYNVHVIASVIGDIVNLFGRVGEDDSYVITGPVWEHFLPQDRVLKPLLRDTPFENDTAMRRRFLIQGFDSFIKEIILDKANGIQGKTVIHPSHVPVVHSLSVVTHEEYMDALHLVEDPKSGGASRSYYRNKMNESKPHMAWARKTLLKAKVFGVTKEKIDFVDLLNVEKKD